ncbi:hypothetical protein [Leptothoe sp. PORK10 BA2]|uniref:hypothetical protein n=1 Tax=Leptothoe sp. PORK10 BA2 TaxID=3110254 RepID=UPI002B1FA8CE|nr:hypothetical protein [Leptothoe sp. PORK10 BA2]MEA5464068.1 hypothetical protein [Leptothoe sp. PORK10 BA2]
MAKHVRPLTDLEQLVHWWHRHQAEWLANEADGIRNGLLQDLFAIRRQLELTPDKEHNSLALVEGLYHELEALGNRLSSPYLHDSLPLAIQDALQQWPADLALSLSIPPHWPREPLEYVALLQSMIEHLRQMLIALPSKPQLLTLSLAEGHAGKQLSLQIDDDTATIPSLIAYFEAADWAYHLNTFEILTGGKVSLSCTGNTILWQLTW